MNEQPGSEPIDPGATDPGPDPAPPPNPAPPPAPDSLPPVAGGPPAPPDLPPGVYPATFTQPGDQPGGTGMPAPKRSRRARGIAAAAVVGLVAAFAKFGLPLLIGVAATGVVGNIFGGAYGRLPSDQQQAFERRYTAAGRHPVRRPPGRPAEGAGQRDDHDGPAPSPGRAAGRQDPPDGEAAGRGRRGDLCADREGDRNARRGRRGAPQGPRGARRRLDRPVVRHQHPGDRGGGGVDAGPCRRSGRGGADPGRHDRSLLRGGGGAARARSTGRGP